MPIIDYTNGENDNTPIVLTDNGTQLKVLSGAATQSGTISETDGPWRIEKIGAGTLTILSALNSYAGGTVITEGVLQGTFGVFGTGAITLNGGTLRAGFNTSLTNSFTINTTGGFIDTNGVSLHLLGKVSDGNGPGGPLTKVGLGTLVLGGDYSGPTIVAAGRLVGSNGSSDFTVAAGAELGGGSVRSLSGAGTVVLDSSVLEVGLYNNDPNLNTIFSGAIVGGGDFEKLGSGTLALTGTSSIAGELLLWGAGDHPEANSLTIDGGSFTAESRVWARIGTLTVANGGELLTDLLAVDSTLVVSGPGSVVTALSGTQIGGDFYFKPASLTISDRAVLNTGGAAALFSTVGSATATVTGVSSAWNIAGDLIAGDTFETPADLIIVSGGLVSAEDVFLRPGSTLVLGDGGLAGNLVAVTIVNEGDIIANFTDTLTLAVAISGAGSLAKSGSGVLTLTGNSSFTGGVVLNAGMLDIAALNAAGTGSIVFAAGAQTLEIDKAALASNSFGNTITSFGAGDAIALSGLTFAAGATATYDIASSLLTVTSEGVTDTLTLSSPMGTTFAAVSDGEGGTAIVLAQVGSKIAGNNRNNKVDATHTIKGQPLPTAADDTISGRSGNDKLDGLNGNDFISGDGDEDKLEGHDGADSLLGAKGEDKLSGGEGDDWLSGGLGENRLTGGGDHDIFIFDGKLGSGSKSKSFSEITDFTVGEDLIELDHLIVAALAVGPLPDSQFVVGKKAVDADDLIIYKPNGKLLYDEDGKGGADAVVFAKLIGAPDVAVSDLLVV